MSDPHTAAVLLNIYSLALGFVVAGITASAASVVTGEPLKFEMAPNESKLMLFIGTCCRIIAGPFMILRNTFFSILVAGREPYWVMIAIVIASLWSFCQGVILLETACQFGMCS